MAEQYQLQLAARAVISTTVVWPENGVAGCSRELGVRIAVRADSGPLPDNITASSIKLLSADGQPLGWDFPPPEVELVSRLVTRDNWLDEVDRQTPTGSPVREERILLANTGLCLDDLKSVAQDSAAPDEKQGKLQVRVTVNSGERSANISVGDIDLGFIS